MCNAVMKYVKKLCWKKQKLLQKKKGMKNIVIVFFLIYIVYHIFPHTKLYMTQNKKKQGQ